jgi:glutaredoxin-like protein
MAIISEKDQKKLKDIFKSLANDVKMLFFTQEFECEHCKMAKGLLEEVAALSEKITLETHDFVKESDLAKKYGIDKIPATILLGDRDYGIRFYGVPAGYEFTSLIEDIIDVSKRDAGLPKELLNELSKVDKPVHIQILISPT